MKKCPSCNQLFEDDNLFCVDDGTTLVAGSDLSQSRLVVSLEDNPPSSEIPTQVVPHPAAPADYSRPAGPPPAVSPDNSKYLYAVIGALIAVIAAMGIWFFALRGPAEKETVKTADQSEKPKNENRSVESFASNQNSAAPVNIPAKNIEKPQANTEVGDNRAANLPAEKQNPAKINFSLKRNFDQTFRGTADDDGISMQLRRSGDSLNGRVFSRRSATDITVSGRIYDDGSFEMNEYSDIGVQTGIYQGRISPDGTMTGTWTKPDGSKPRPVFLRAN